LRNCAVCQQKSHHLRNNGRISAEVLPGGIKTQELRRHTVQKGDTLSGIARKYYGKSSAFRLILNANKEVLKGKDQLQIGQILVIPSDPATGDPKP